MAHAPKSNGQGERVPLPARAAAAAPIQTAPIEATPIRSARGLHGEELLPRVEALVPIEVPTVHRQVLNQIMVANLNDDAQSWEMGADGNYTRIVASDPDGGFSAHNYFMDNPSLSGRGSALVVSEPPRLAPRKRERKSK